VSEDDFNDAVEEYRQALTPFLNGDPEPVLALFSRRNDVTLANPLGPPQRGPADVERAVRAAAHNFTAGTIQFDELTRYATADLGYVVQLEPSEVQLADTGKTVRIMLRVTMIFRREEGVWRVVHRHADPITTARPIDTAVEP
jgi:ketosteroid isomerase-like protein